jgi:hypothetical protein
MRVFYCIRQEANMNELFKLASNFLSSPKYRIKLLLILLLLISLSCTITGGSDPSLEQTKAALNVQMTVVAQQAGQNQQITSEAASLTKVAGDVQATVLAQQATQLAIQATQLVQNPPATVPPVENPSTEAPVQETEAPPETNIDDQIKNAKILLFEDMAGTGFYEYWQQALEAGGYTFKDDGSAQGWFKDDLLSTNKWDLIIAASESRTKIQGEYFQYLLTHINNGVGVIIEHWDLDDLSQGKIAPIFAKCGVALYKDWFAAIGSVPNLSTWPLQPDNPIFHEPYDGVSLRSYADFWRNTTDRGDLLKLTGSGDAIMLMGTIATSKQDHGTLVSCLDGRLLIQTHSSHEYRQEYILNLMQNMIYYTLKNHFMTGVQNQQ